MDKVRKPSKVYRVFHVFYESSSSVDILDSPLNLWARQFITATIAIDMAEFLAL
jgi:hypothetical protein